MITKLFVSRPTLAVVLIAIAVIGGGLAMFALREQQLPNVGLPNVDIILFYPGATPVEMRDQIVRPIEDQLAGAPSLQHTQTQVEQGYASIVAQFSLKSSPTEDLVEVQRRIQAAQSQLPSDLETPRIETFDPAESAVVTLAVSSPTLASGALSALIQNQLVPAIEQVTGVGYVQPNGTVTPSIQVEVDPAKLKAKNVTINDVVNTIAVNNIRLPGGILYGRSVETGVNIRGDIHGPSSVGDLSIQLPGGGSVPVADVARVSDSFETPRIYAYVNGAPSFFLTVLKSSGANEVDTAKGVIDALPALQQRFPDVRFAVIANQSSFTQSLLRGVVRTLLEGIALVAIVMIFFLRSWRNAAAVLIAIPTSLFATLIVMLFLHFTLDIVSLLAMTLITGILVDDSIVVLENSERHREMGESAIRAAVNGRLEIGLAAIVITLVDVVVFVPIAFLPGIVGRFLSEFALVVVVATLSSLLVSFTITPALAGNWALLSSKRTLRLIDLFGGGFERLRVWYAQKALPWGLSHTGAVVSIAVITFVLALALVPLGIIGFEFDPPQDNGEMFIQLDYPSGTPLSVTRATVRKLEAQLRTTVSDLDSETSLAGASTSPVGGYLVDGAVGQIDLRLRAHRKHSTDYWVARVRSLVQSSAAGGNAVVIPATSAYAGNTQPIDYLVSDSTGDPTNAARKVFDALSKTEGAANVYSSAATLAPQLDISFNADEARRLKVSLRNAATAIRAAFGGVRATQYEAENGLKDVEVVYPASYLRSLDQLRQIRVRADDGSIVRVDRVTHLKFASAARSIDRVDRQTVVHVSANVAPGYSLSGVQKAFEQNLAALDFPAGVHVAPNSVGTQQNLSDTVNGMAVALALGMILVFLLMVALYNSYLSPFIIMFSVPLAVVGALGALAITRQTLNAFSLIGTVLLIGLVTKNGILLVDFANQLRERGLDKLAAIRESARVRFRPIIMTTAAMVFGMLPLALGLDRAVASRRSLAIVVIGGLISSLLLTLIIIPIVYVWLSPDRIRLRRRTSQLRAVDEEEAIGSSGRAAL